MASRARTARRAGRARHHRIDRDAERKREADARALAQFEGTVQEREAFKQALVARSNRNHVYAHAVASGPGLPSPVPSDWDRVVGPVQRWRAIYKHLAARRSLWKQVLADECNRFVTVDGVRIDLHKAVKTAEKIASLDSDERERALDFYTKCSADITPEWIQTTE